MTLEDYIQLIMTKFNSARTNLDVVHYFYILTSNMFHLRALRVTLYALCLRMIIIDQSSNRSSHDHINRGSLCLILIDIHAF